MDFFPVERYAVTAIEILKYEPFGCSLNHRMLVGNERMVEAYITVQVFTENYCGPRKRDSMLRCKCTVPERGINGQAEVHKRVQSEGSVGSD